MDLEEYLTTYRITIKELAEKSGMHVNTLSQLKRKAITPRLDNAILLWHHTHGKVSLCSMINEKAQKKIEHIRKGQLKPEAELQYEFNI